MAILSTPERRMLLNDIYQYVMDNFEYYNNNEKAWRNSIRHNLSLNECFIKAGRADNGMYPKLCILYVNIPFQKVNIIAQFIDNVSKSMEITNNHVT